MENIKNGAHMLEFLILLLLGVNCIIPIIRIKNYIDIILCVIGVSFFIIAGFYL